MSKFKKDLQDQLSIYEEDIYSRVERLITNKVSEGGPEGLSAGDKVTASYLQNLSRERWFEIRMRDEAINSNLEQLSSKHQRAA